MSKPQRKSAASCPSHPMAITMQTSIARKLSAHSTANLVSPPHPTDRRKASSRIFASVPDACQDDTKRPCHPTRMTSRQMLAVLHGLALTPGNHPWSINRPWPEAQISPSWTRPCNMFETAWRHIPSKAPRRRALASQQILCLSGITLFHMAQSRGRPRTALMDPSPAALGEHSRTSRTLRIDTRRQMRKRSSLAKCLLLPTKHPRSSTIKRRLSNDPKPILVRLHRTLLHRHPPIATASALVKLIMRLRASPWISPNRDPHKTIPSRNGRPRQMTGRRPSRRA